MVNGVIDIGNSEVKYGVFEKDRLLEQGRIVYGDWQTLLSLKKEYSVESWIISSVQKVPDENELGFSYLLLTEKTPLPVTNQYKTPSTLGKDRIAAICGASSLFKETSVLVIDAGTCITYDFMTSKQEYIGGSISPGIKMRFKAMHEFTGKLPLIELKTYPSFYGQSTEESLLTGVSEGIIGEATHLIKEYKKAFGPLQVLCCGGDAGFFEKRLKMNIFAAPYLVLIGLNQILRYNQSLHA